MAYNEDIIVQVIPGAASVARVGFGVPLLAGTTGQRSILITGAGPSTLVAKSTPRQHVVSLEIVTGPAYAYAFAAGVVTIDVPVGAKVRELIADFNANAPSPVTDELTLVAGGSGSGVVGLIAPTALTFEKKKVLVSLTQVEYYFDNTDSEYKILKNMFASAPAPIRIVLLDVLAEIADIGAALTLNDDGSWYCVLTNSLVESENQAISDFVDGVQRLFIMVDDDITVLDRIKSRRTAILIHDAPGDYPQASWAAKMLPSTPGSMTWKFATALTGQTPNATISESELLTVRSKNGQAYVLANGVTMVDEGRTNDPAGITYIDEVRAQDWIDLNLTADILQVFIDAAAAGSKIPYTDGGIAIVGGAVQNRLTLAGKNGIIGPVETASQAEQSSDGSFRYKVDLPTRADIIANDPGQITARNLPDITFQYVPAGAIHEVKTITGRVVLSEVN